MKRLSITLSLLAIAVGPIAAQPIVTSWQAEHSGRYARIYETTAAESASQSVTTWSRGEGIQDQPTYAGVNEVSVSATHVYIRTSGLGYHVMGPWYGNEAKTNLFVNYPANQAVIYALPLDPGSIPSTISKTIRTVGIVLSMLYHSKTVYSSGLSAEFTRRNVCSCATRCWYNVCFIIFPKAEPTCCKHSIAIF